MKNFSDYNFKPSDVIEGLNKFYEFTESHKDYRYAAFVIYTKEPSKAMWTFSKSRVPDAITWLREECDIFYTPGMNWVDLKYKLTSRACEKEYGTDDIWTMFPKCLVKPRTSKMGWTDEEKEALEALCTLYYDVATRHERSLMRLDDPSADWPKTSYMVEYIRKRAKTAEENVEYLCKENDDLRNQVQNLKDLINRIHEDSDI